MAITSVRSTYALDVETVAILERLAARQGVSKSEALRRAIRLADRESPAPDPIAALDALQRSLGMTAEQTERWAQDVRAEREASSVRRLTKASKP
jgi:hypothetical protein